MSPTPKQIVAALKDYKVTVIEDRGWTTRGAKTSNGVLRPFTPYGQAVHHDAFSEAVSDATALRVMREGRVDLSGPLCNGWIDSSGVVYLISAHNANHAGWNERDVHDRLSKGLQPMGDARNDPDKDGIVGNTFLWGWECRNAGDGRDPWEQLGAMERSCAAIADVFGWSGNAIAGHRELTARKIDPAGIDMFQFRRDVKKIMADHNAPPPEDDMEPPRIVWYSDPQHNIHAYLVRDSGIGKHLDGGGLDVAKFVGIKEANPPTKPLNEDWQDTICLMDGPLKNV